MPADPRPLAKDFLPATRTLPELLRRQAERFGDAPLFKSGATTWSFRQTCDIAAGAAARFQAAGINPGDRIALICGNRPEFMELFLGCAWSGAIAVPINTAARGPSLRHMLDNSDARLLIAEPALEETLAGIPFAQRWNIENLPPLGDPVPPAEIGPGDPLAILYTSGTTGPSKGVICPHAQMFWWGINAGALLELREADVLATTLPLFHTNALNAFCQALIFGATLHVEPRFSASGFWPAMAQSGATIGYLLGAMVPILLARPPGALERAHRIRLALAPGVPARFHAPFTERTGIRLLDGYGSTETNFVLGTTVENLTPGWMGPVVPGFEAQIVDALDNPLPDGEAGELVLRADEPFAFANGYWRMPEKTVESWSNLRFHTGDRVLRHGENFRFVDRMKDAIRRRGENISSFEVEQVLLAHPAVANAAVFPVRAEMAEDEVMAAILLHPGAAATPEDIIVHCTGELAYFAVPRYLDFVSVLPATESGKIQKYRLIERGITPSTWDRGDTRRPKGAD